VIINDLHVIRIAIPPLKTNPILIVDTDTVLSSSITSGRLQPIAWQRRQVIQADGIIQHLQLAPSHCLEGLKALDPIIVEQPLRFLAFKRPYQRASLS